MTPADANEILSVLLICGGILGIVFVLGQRGTP